MKKILVIMSVIIFSGIVLGIDYGSATISPSVDVTINTKDTWNIVYFLPSGLTIKANEGFVAVAIPNGWTPPTTLTGAAGYVTCPNPNSVVSITQTTRYDYYSGSTVTLAGAVINFSSDLSGPAYITLVYGADPTQKAVAPNTPSSPWYPYTFKVFVKLNANSSLVEVPSPKINVTDDTVRRIGFNDWSNIIVKKDAPSSEIKIYSLDWYGNQVKASSNIVITLSVYNNWDDAWNAVATPRSSGKFYSNSNATTTITISAGTSSASVWYEDTETGTPVMKLSAFGYSETRQINVISGITNVYAESGNVKSTLVTIDLTNDTIVDDVAYINFSLDYGSAFRIWIDLNKDGTLQESDPPQPTDDYVYYSWGNIARVEWWAKDRMWNNVPNGTYPVHIELGSWIWNPNLQKSVFTPVNISDTSLSIEVKAGFIQGTVYANGSVLPDVVVEAGGPSWGSARTDNSGYYKISGLKYGDYWINFRKSGYIENHAQAKVSSISGTTVDITLTTGATLHIRAVRPASLTLNYDVWGGASIFNKNTKQWVGWATIHFAQGTSTLSDNGFWTGDVNYKNYSEISVAPGTYQIKLERIGNFGASGYDVDGTPGTGEIAEVTLNAGETKTVTFNLTKRASITGTIQLPAGTVHNGMWVNVWAEKKGSTNWMDNYYGGVWLNPTVVTGSYIISGVSQGTYIVKAKAEGFVETKYPNDVIVSSDADVTADIPEFSRGVSITGTITIEGNNQDRWVWISAWNPSANIGSGTQVHFTLSETLQAYAIGGLTPGNYEINIWIDGYEMKLEGKQEGDRIVQVTSSGANQNIIMKKFSGWIEGTVVLTGTGDYTKVVVTCNPMGGWAGFATSIGGTSTLDANHRYKIEGLGTGGYLVSASYQGGGYAFKSAIVKVANGKGTTFDFTSLPSCTITGKVTTLSKDPKFNTISNFIANAESLNNVSLARVVAVPVTPFGGGEDPQLNYNGEGYFGLIDTLGNYTIVGLPPGTYKVFVPSDVILSDNPSQWQRKPNIACVPKIVTVLEGAKSADLTIIDGYKVSGSITIDNPDTFQGWMDIRIKNAWSSSGWKEIRFEGTTSINYFFDKLAPGEYVIQVGTQKYANATKIIKIVDSDLSDQNFKLVKGATIKGKLKDADSGTILNANNYSSYLPNNFRIFVEARPWVEGGYKEADNWQGLIDNEGYFTISNIPAGTYDLILKQEDYEMTSSSKNNYVPVIIAGIIIPEDTTGSFVKDVGVIELKRGIQICGSVKEKGTGKPLPNILVEAKPAVKGSWHTKTRVRTDAYGKYVLTGIDENAKYYTIIAAPRSSDAMIDLMAAGDKYGEVRKEDIDITKPENRIGIDFELELANCAVSGRVIAETLAVPKGMGDSSWQDMPVALVFLQKEGDFSTKDPIGNIQMFTEPDGKFRIDGLVPGTYKLRVMNRNYAMTTIYGIVLNAGTVTNIGDITLQKGGTVSGTVLKPDGSKPNTSEVSMVVAATADFDQILFGEVISDTTTKLVSGYKVQGLQPDIEYGIILVPYSEQEGPPDNMVYAGVVKLTSANEERNLNVIYKPTAPVIICQVGYKDGKYILSFFSTQTIRNKYPDGEDSVENIITLVSGAGTLSDKSISADRRNMKAIYTPSPSDTVFKVKVSAYSTTVNIETNTEFKVEEEFEIYIGADGFNYANISNLLGGEVKIDGDKAKAVFPTGTFDVSMNQQVKAKLFKFKTFITTSGTPKLASSAYPNSSYAMFMKQPKLTDVFSGYYDVVITGGKIAAGKSYIITLPYDPNYTGDPNELNVYYYDSANNVWRKEANNKSISTVNRTISVSVSHASRFVIVKTSAETIGGDRYDGTEFKVYNFPNPFDLSIKWRKLTHLGGGQEVQFTGTMIKYALPTGKDGKVEFKIYNIAGELVRTIDEGEKQGGYYYYTEWDGKNDKGEECASGVYICVAKAKDVTKTFKMVIIK
jgi:hypothetical protein